jgi:AAA family ATP:ADP antiporter
MSDVFSAEQGRRLFGILSMGGTLGAIVGAATTEALAGGRIGLVVSPASMLPLALIGLELAVACMVRLANHCGLASEATAAKEPGPSPHEGLRLIARSRYLQLICLYILLFTITSTLLYLIQGRIVERTFQHAAARTSAFARIDLWVNVVTLAVQALFTGRLIRGLGLTRVLMVLPLMTVASFGALVVWPAFAVLAAIQVLRRGLHYALDRPAREVLYIPLGPEEKYKSKPFIDTFVYRGGDLVGVWLPTLVGSLSLPIAVVALTVSSAWMCSSLWLGRVATTHFRRS